MTEMNQLDASLEQAVERYNLANVKLDRIRKDQRMNAFELRVAQSNLKKSRRAIERRLVSLYTSEQSSTLEVVLGAKSLDDVLNRIENADRVSTLDSQVLKEVKVFRASVKLHERQLAAAKAAQERLVAERAAQRRAVQAKLAERRQMLSSIKGQIAQLLSAQRARSLQMARIARARLASTQRESAQQAEDTVVGVTAAAPEGVTVAPPSQYGGVVGVAMSYLGVPYAWGGGSPAGFDCSGLVAYAYAQVGVSLPHSSYAQYGVGVPVSKDQVQAGDLVFFDGLGHVGIYIGGGQFVHAPHSGDVVKVSSLGDSWYASTYVGARRIL
jgi:cell wall-associated NlpC family hydrolase